MYNLLIRNARIARPDGTSFEGDVACEDGRIARMDSNISAPAHETIDAAGKLLLPGVIDPQVHFRDPGSEYKEDLGTGSRAAVRGGVTSFLEMPNTAPPTTTQAALDEKLARAARNSVANYGFFIGATPDHRPSPIAFSTKVRFWKAGTPISRSCQGARPSGTQRGALYQSALVALARPRAPRHNGKIREQPRGRPLTYLT